VADGLSKIKQPYGGYLEGLVMYAPKLQEGDTKVVGQAFTVKFVPKLDKEAPSLSGHYVCVADQISLAPLHHPM
jgi:regulator of RNase E activity RraA